MGVDAARRSGPAVEYARHRVFDGITGLAAAEELQMQVGRRPVNIHGAIRSGQALRDELPSVRPLSGRTAGGTDPRIGVGTRRDIEQVEQGTHATVPDSVRPLISSGVIPSHSPSTAAVSSPSAGAATAGRYSPSISRGRLGAK